MPEKETATQWGCLQPWCNRGTVHTLPTTPETLTACSPRKFTIAKTELINFFSCVNYGPTRRDGPVMPLPVRLLIQLKIREHAEGISFTSPESYANPAMPILSKHGRPLLQ